MLLLLVLADDFTGALDTGVQFAACGISTRVVVGEAVEMEKCDSTVLVIDTETRHLPAKRAHDIVYRLTERARQTGVGCVYKKTDSALRGNIGAELSAVLEAGGSRQLPFLPAFPQIGRTTEKGIHYIDGIEVTKSPFGQDPFEPVKHAQVTELIAEQSDIPAYSCGTLTAEEPVPSMEGILVFDAAATEDLDNVGAALCRAGSPRVLAGCAGFAAKLPTLLKLPAGERPHLPKLDPRLLVLCGSVNPITLRQMDMAEQTGFLRLRLTPQQKLTPGYWDSEPGEKDLAEMEQLLSSHPRCIIETNDAGGNQLTADYARERGIDLEGIRQGIAGSVGSMLGKLFTSPALGTLLLTGGDTLLQCMNSIGVQELEPICEMEKGVVLARFTYRGCSRYVITKSGGFGQENLLISLAEKIKETGGKE